MKLVNLTGHEIAVTDGSTIKRLPSEGKARVISEGSALGVVEIAELARPLPITEVREVRIVELPDPEPDTLFIVSGIVAAHVPLRLDVVAPGRTLREKGRVIGCQGFVKPVPKVA